ncbi:S24 family peptidase [Solidesulfovibrio sp.]
MTQDSGSAIVLRLAQALTARGAHDAARQLACAHPPIDTANEAEVRSLALQHCREHALDPDWVLLGLGRPENPPPKAELTPVFAMNSVHPTTGRWQWREIERIALSPTILSPGRFVSRMEQRCLEPHIRHGAYLVIDTTRSRVPEDREKQEAFAVDVRDEGLVVRLTWLERSAGRLVLEGLAPSFPPLYAPWKSPECRVVGRVAWVAQPL